MRLIIIDDDRFVCDSLKIILDAEEDIEVVAVGYDGLEAERLYRTHHPDILLTDIQMPIRNGLEAAQAILVECPNARIVLLTTFSDDEYIVSALRIGVKGYLIKQDVATLAPALRLVLAGQSVLGSEVLGRMDRLINVEKPVDDDAADNSVGSIYPGSTDECSDTNAIPAGGRSDLEPAAGDTNAKPAGGRSDLEPAAGDTNAIPAGGCTYNPEGRVHVNELMGSNSADNTSSATTKSDGPLAVLTAREYEITELVARGLDNREIAGTLFISEGTVRNLVSTILTKLDLKNRTQLAIMFYRND